MKNKRNVKYVPPLLLPVLWVVIGVEYVIRFFMWLVGFWRCSECKTRYFIYDERRAIIVSDVVSKLVKNEIKQFRVLKRRKVCVKCHIKLKEEQQQQLKGETS